jgi:hypothetical protein
MKNLKIKLSSLSVLVIVAIVLSLTSCQKETLIQDKPTLKNERDVEAMQYTNTTYNFTVFETTEELDSYDETTYQNALNDDNVMQFEDIVCKYDDVEGFVYIMKANDLNSTRYTALVNGNFDDTYMSKLKQGHDYDGIENYLDGNIGYDGTGDINSDPIPKFWGWGPWKRNGPGSVVYVRYYYVFGFKFLTQTDVKMNGPD